MDISSILQDGSFFNWHFFHFPRKSRGWKGTTMNPMLPELVGQRLEALRIATGLPKGDFADTVKVDRSSYSKIIKGEKPLKAEMAFIVSERWDVAMDYLYRGRLDNLPSHLSKKIIEALNAIDA